MFSWWIEFPVFAEAIDITLHKNIQNLCATINLILTDPLIAWNFKFHSFYLLWYFYGKKNSMFISCLWENSLINYFSRLVIICLSKLLFKFRFIFSIYCNKKKTSLIFLKISLFFFNCIFCHYIIRFMARNVLLMRGSVHYFRVTESEFLLLLYCKPNSK